MLPASRAPGLQTSLRLVSAGLHATIRDAQARHVKDPRSASSFIPARCQTYAAPASYALHYVLGPPQFDWTKLKEPVRFNCRDQSVQLLAEPQLVEDIGFAEAMPPPGTQQPAAPLSFRVSPERLAANEAVYLQELRREGAKDKEAIPLARWAMSIARHTHNLRTRTTRGRACCDTRPSRLGYPPTPCRSRPSPRAPAHAPQVGGHLRLRPRLLAHPGARPGGGARRAFARRAR